MEFIKTHKIVIAVTAVCLVLLIVAGAVFYKVMFPSNAESVNGDRLVSAPVIDQVVIDQVLGELNKNEKITATYNKNVRILKFLIKTTNMKLEDAKKLTTVIEEKLSDEILTYYDIEVFLTQEETDGYNSIGYRAKGVDSKDTKDEDKHVFVWSYNGVGKDE